MRVRWKRCVVFGNDKAVAHAANLRHLPQSVIYLVAAPSTPVKVREQVLERA
jgi:hypothetical protein